jgi:hypothetical protein
LIVIKGDHVLIVKIDRMGIKNEEDQEVYQETFEEESSRNEFIVC